MNQNENNESAVKEMNEMKGEFAMNELEKKNDVMRSVLKLMRAMRRQPVRPANEFPPAIQRTLWILRKTDGITAADLCEKLDVRPSSMSELLGRMEEKFLIKREGDENDKRAVKILLSETGKEAADRMEAKITAERDKFTACFTDEEAEKFAELCDKLSAHLEETGETGKTCHGPHGHRGGFGHGRHHGPMGGHVVDMRRPFCPMKPEFPGKFRFGHPGKFC